MLSVLMQVFVDLLAARRAVGVYGYALAFTEGNAFFGGFDTAVPCSGMFDPPGRFAKAATFSKGVVIPELHVRRLPGTFAAITPALIVGAFAERMKFSAVLLFIGAVVHLLLPADRAHGVVLGGPGRLSPTPRLRRQG